MRDRLRRLLTTGVAAALALAAAVVAVVPGAGPAVLALTVTKSLGRSMTTRTAVQVGAPPPWFTG